MIKVNAEEQRAAEDWLFACHAEDIGTWMLAMVRIMANYMAEYAKYAKSKVEPPKGE